MRITSFTRSAHLGLFLYLAGAATSSSLAHAEIDLCNGTERQLLITYRAPASSCDTRSSQDHVLLNGGACLTVGNGSAKGKSFYYFAEDQYDRQAFWAGDIGLWIPNNTQQTPLSNCTGSIACHPSSGSACGDGRIYNMREYIGPSARYTYTLTE